MKIFAYIKGAAASGDKNFVEIIRHTFWALVILAVGTVVQFAFDFSLTHSFGAHGTGTFYLCFSVLMLLSLFGRLGIDRAVVRFLPPLVKSDPAKAAGVLYTATLLPLLISVPLAILLFVLSPWAAADVFHSAELTNYLRIFAFALPALALNYVFSGVLRALKRTKSALSIERLTMYALGILAVLTLGRLYGLQAATIGFVVAIWLSTIEGAVYIKRAMPANPSIEPFSKKRMLVTSGPLLFMVFATYMNGQASVLLLGVFSTNADVGIFNIALKVSLLMSLILSAVNVIAATQFSELYASGQHKQLQTVISKVSALGALAGLPLFIVLALAAPFWLSLFGSEFVSGATALIVLAAGQLVNVVLGSSNYVLAMTGHERALATAVSSSLVFNVLLGLLLIPAFGVIGAGITTAATLVVSNSIMAIMVRRYLDVWLLPFRYLNVWLSNLRKTA